MRSAVFWLASVLLVGSSLFANAAAAAPGDAPISECEQARRDWAANYPSIPPGNNRLAYLSRESETSRLRFDLNCDDRLSFEEYLAMTWESWRWKDTNSDGVVTQSEYVADFCTQRLGGVIRERPDWRATCEEASASNYRKFAGPQRARGIDQRVYHRTASVLFRRADRNGDGFLTRSRNPAEAYE